MRPGQNKRMRGRNNSSNNRKGPNPLTRSYESNGPDVKIRGTAFHIGEKYLQLARDAQSSGDPVMAESYLQHAEHYFRLIAAAQQAQQQAQFGYQRPAGEQAEQDEGDDDDDFASLPDRFASPSERIAAPPQPAQPQPPQDRQPFSGHQGGERYDRAGGNGQSQPPQYGDRQGNDRQSYERPDRGQDNRGPDNRGPDNRNQDRNYDNRNNRGGYQDRNGYDRNANFRGDGGNQDRNGQERGNRDNGQPRDFDNRNFRNRNRDDRQPREFRDNQPRESGQPREYQPREIRDARPPVTDEQPGGLPAFITAPVRTPQDTASEPPTSIETPETNAEMADDSGFHMRPRRRRRPKADFAGVDGDSVQEAPASDPVGD